MMLAKICLIGLICLCSCSPSKKMVVKPKFESPSVQATRYLERLGIKVLGIDCGQWFCTCGVGWGWTHCDYVNNNFECEYDNNFEFSTVCTVNINSRLEKLSCSNSGFDSRCHIASK